MAHGCSAQWKYEYSIATCAAASVLGRAALFGGAAMCDIGSATP
jgi:hypothetical protein